jgi:hypothetical protein
MNYQESLAHRRQRGAHALQNPVEEVYAGGYKRSAEDVDEEPRKRHRSTDVADLEGANALLLLAQQVTDSSEHYDSLANNIGDLTSNLLVRNPSP